MSFLINPYVFPAAAPPAFLLDDYPGAAAAYSLRQLRTGVTNVVRVRRSSDNAELDFTAAQITDGTLIGWVGAGNNGFATNWYDQSGNNRTATQAVTANQPKIVNAGSIVQTNNKPSLDFDGIAQRFDMPTIAFTMNALSVNIVCKSDSSTSTVAFANPDPNRVYAPLLSSGVYYVGYGNTATAFNFGSLSLTSQYLVQLNAGSSTANAWRNGSPSAAITSSTASEVGPSISIGSYQGPPPGSLSSFWDGTIQEVVFYTSDKTLDQLSIASNINGHYAIY